MKYLEKIKRFQWDGINLTQGLGILFIIGVVVRLGFMFTFSGEIFHEDSLPYIQQAERYLTEGFGGFLPHRSLGYPLFIAAISKLFFTNNLLFVIGAQHILSIIAFLMLAYLTIKVTRKWYLGLIVFTLLLIDPRLIQYDNNIGAENLTVFTSVFLFWGFVQFIAKKWNFGGSIVFIAVVSTYFILVRTGNLPVVLLFCAILCFPVLGLTLYQRIGAGVALLVPGLLAMKLIVSYNGKNFGYPYLAADSRMVRVFPVAYSLNLDHGIHLDIKEKLKPYLTQQRSMAGEYGYWTNEKGNFYQWTFRILEQVRDSLPPDGKSVEEREAKARVVIGEFFKEMLLSPVQVASHLNNHVLRELKFALFYPSPTSRGRPSAGGLRYFTERDGKDLSFFQEPLAAAEQAKVSFFGKKFLRLKGFSEKLLTVYSTAIFLSLFSFVSVCVLLWMLVSGGLSVFKARKIPSLNAETITRFLGITIGFGFALIYCYFVYALNRYSVYYVPFVFFAGVMSFHLILGNLTSYLKRLMPKESIHDPA